MAKREKYTLVGCDGNAFAVMGYVAKCMKKEGYSQEDIDQYRAEATSGKYENLICVSMKYIDMCNGEDKGVITDEEEDERFKEYSFSECSDLNDSENIVMLGVIFKYEESELKEVDDFFHQIELIPEDSHVTGLHKIYGNVEGDEGRTDVVISFTPCKVNPMARLRYGRDLKWVSDFVDNFSEDYDS